jgi:hypothetical protein
MYGCSSIGSFILWWIIPVTNLVFWYSEGFRTDVHIKCTIGKAQQINTASSAWVKDSSAVECDEDFDDGKERMPWDRIKLTKRPTECIPNIEHNIQQNNVPTSDLNTISIHTIDNEILDKHRNERMATMTFAEKNSVIITAPGTSPSNPEGCQTYEAQWMSSEPQTCFATVFIKNIDLHRNSYSIQRFDSTVDENNKGEKDRPEPHHPLKAPFVGNEHNIGHRRPIGFFRKIPATRGFQRVQDKLGPFVKYYDDADPTTMASSSTTSVIGIEKQLTNKLKLNNIKSGDDVTLMVVNEGEIDLWLNFACSCKENGLIMTNVFVFVASPEIIPLIESTGAMALYHIGYASVSKKASNDYLDRVFVDMMWYKAFSVHLLTARGINILFQDVDLVWFRNPFEYFKEYIATAKKRSIMTGSHPEGFYSDDGQRSLRYSPFFANSGFYYLLGGPKAAYLAWSIMISFDAVQVLGSHQNVFTAKMVEGLSLGYQHAVILPLYKFPTGIVYHHDRKYMRRLKHKEENPYGFHMCWTQGKPDKLINLRKASMWYLTETCSPLNELIEGGSIYKQVELRSKPNNNRNQKLSESSGTTDTGAYGGGLGGFTHDVAVNEHGNPWSAGIDTTCCMSMEGGPGLKG